jgi:midasin
MPAFYDSYVATIAPVLEGPTGTISWNECMKRMFTLAHVSLTHGEPVLLVGETGCGKTTVCQVLAELAQTGLLMVNCH